MANGCPRVIRKKDKAMQAVEVLVEYGWLFPLDGPVTIKDRVRQEGFRVVV